MENKRYIIFVERDEFADPKRYPDGVAWRSGVLDANNGEEVIDQQGDLPDYGTAAQLALNCINRLL